MSGAIPRRKEKNLKCPFCTKHAKLQAEIGRHVRHNHTHRVEEYRQMIRPTCPGCGKSVSARYSKHKVCVLPLARGPCPLRRSRRRQGRRHGKPRCRFFQRYTVAGMKAHLRQAHGLGWGQSPPLAGVHPQRPAVPYRLKTLREYAADPRSGPYVVLRGLLPLRNATRAEPSAGRAHQAKIAAERAEIVPALGFSGLP